MNTQLRVINEYPTYFPVITLCNLNYFTSNYSIDFLKAAAMSNNLPDIFNSSAYEPSEFYQLQYTYLFTGYASVVDQNLTREEIENLGYSMEDMLLSCSFDTVSCSYTDFAWFFHPKYGLVSKNGSRLNLYLRTVYLLKRNCYQFNSGRNMNGESVPFKRVLQTGSSGGFTAELFVGLPKMLEVLATNFGLIVFVHDVNTSPLSVEPITISPNTETNVVVSKTKLKKQAKPYSECQDLDKYESELKNLILNKGFFHIFCSPKLHSNKMNFE